MKRMIALLLTLETLLSLTACGGSTPTETASVETTALAVTEVPTEVPTEAPTTEPTLSPEEMLYNSLPDRMKQAVDAGIVELYQLEDLNRIVTVGEASQMLQKAFVHRTGVESKTLRDLMVSPDYSSRNATRGWIVNIPGLADMELVKGNQYKTYEQWIKLYNKPMEAEALDSFWVRYNSRLYMIHWSENPVVSADGDVYGERSPVIELAQDFPDCRELMKSDLLYGPGEKDKRFLDIPHYAFRIYDQTNGKKFFKFEDNCVNPEKELTMEAAVEYALIYHNSSNPMAYPTFVAPEEVGAFNSDIITADLLNKETNLPGASCQRLPKEWHGTVMDDFQFANEKLMHPDFEIYEYEIQKVKEAGFNFIGLCLDFSWLQDNVLTDKSRKAYEGFLNKEDVGKLSQERLEKLDQVIAWCMKYDIHVNLRCTALGGMNNSVNMYSEISKNSATHAESLASLWQAIARRYADIPNTYLSFTLFTGNYPVENNMILPSVDSIRTVSPERCIIADICSNKMESKGFAELGVALSCSLYEPEKQDSFFNLIEYWNFARNGGIFVEMFDKNGHRVVQNFTWPYKEKTDAAELFSSSRNSGESTETVMETAQAYGVGFMLGDFGVTVGGNWGFTLDRVRYADEPYFAMIEDITSTMEELGYGWCFSHWYGPYGVAFSIPAIKTCTYEQVADYPYYIDQGMMNLFKELNSVQ